MLREGFIMTNIKIYLRNFALFLAVMSTLFGCASLKEGLSKAVIMDYDQVNNFRNYSFDNFAINWGGGASETGITGFATQTDTKGFWATFVICNLRNEGSEAES